MKVCCAEIFIPDLKHKAPNHFIKSLASLTSTADTVGILSVLFSPLRKKQTSSHQSLRGSSSKPLEEYWMWYFLTLKEIVLLIRLVFKSVDQGSNECLLGTGEELWEKETHKDHMPIWPQFTSAAKESSNHGKVAVCSDSSLKMTSGFYQVNHV